MATVEKHKQQGSAEVKYQIIGNAWAKKLANGNNAGKVFLSVKLDRGSKVTLDESDVIFLMPSQTRREGKRDPQYRVLVQSAA